MHTLLCDKHSTTISNLNFGLFYAKLSRRQYAFQCLLNKCNKSPGCDSGTGWLLPYAANEPLCSLRDVYGKIIGPNQGVGEKGVLARERLIGAGWWGRQLPVRGPFFNPTRQPHQSLLRRRDNLYQHFHNRAETFFSSEKVSLLVRRFGAGYDENFPGVDITFEFFYDWSIRLFFGKVLHNSTGRYFRSDFVIWNLYLNNA